MGIEIHLRTIPARIPPEKWQKVYEESLVLVEKYHFMDRYKRRRPNGLTYVYGARSRERNDIYEKYRGWQTAGDMYTGYNTEDFEMLADIEYYREDKVDDGGDVLASLVYSEDYPELKAPDNNTMAYVFGAKTQGEDSHIYLLAIACLVVARLPGAAVVSGDINVGQCTAAVQWANKYLAEPISVPIQCEANLLLHRLLMMEGAPQLLENGRILDLFFSISMQNKDQKMGDAIRKHIPEKTIVRYYRNKYKDAAERSIHELEREAKEYLELGFDLRSLAELLVTDPDGCKIQPNDFFDMIFRMQLHVQEKMTYDMTKGDKESPKPDDVGMLFARVFGQMASCGNRNVDAFYSLEEISSICKDVMGNLCDVDSQIREALKRDADRKEQQSGGAQDFFYSDGSPFEKMVDEKQKQDEEAKQYDIKNMDDIVYFDIGDSIEPNVEDVLRHCFRQIHAFAETEEFENFKDLDRDEREEYFIKRNRSILIHESTWDRIFSRIMDDDYMKRFFALFRTDISRQKVYNLVEAVINNLELLDYFWDSTSAETNVDGNKEETDSEEAESREK